MARPQGEIRHKPAPSSSRPTTNGRPPFALVPLLPGGGPALQALRAGEIEPQDFAVLEALRQAFEWKGGRCWAEWVDLVNATGMPEETVKPAAERLMQAQLLAVGRHSEQPSWRFWALHPDLASGGRTAQQAERMRWAQWEQLLAAGARPDDPVPGYRPRRAREWAREQAARAAAA